MSLTSGPRRGVASGMRQWRRTDRDRLRSAVPPWATSVLLRARDAPYGIDCAFRDPFGNHIRVAQPAEQPSPVTDEDITRWSGSGAPLG